MTGAVVSATTRRKIAVIDSFGNGDSKQKVRQLPFVSVQSCTGISGCRFIPRWQFLAHNLPKRNLCKAMRTHISPSALVAAFAVALALLASPANGRSLRSTAAIISTISTTAVDETPSTSNPLVNQDRRRLEYGIDDLIVFYGNETYAYSTSMQYEYNPSGQSSSSVTVTDANMCVTAEGNSWKAIPIPSNATVSTTDKTVLSFQFSYEQVADINAICLDEDTAFATSGQLRCFAVSAAQGWVASKYFACAVDGKILHLSVK